MNTYLRSCEGVLGGGGVWETFGVCLRERWGHVWDAFGPHLRARLRARLGRVGDAFEDTMGGVLDGTFGTCLDPA